MTESLTLGFDLRFADLYGRDGLVRLDGQFVDFLKAQSPELHNRLMTARAAPEQLEGKPESDLIVELAPQLEDFIAELFGIAHEVRALRSRHEAWRRSIRSSGCSCSAAPPRNMARPGRARSTAHALRRRARGRCSAARSPSCASPSSGRARWLKAEARATPTPLRLWPRATPPGRRTRRRARRAQAPASCSRCRTRLDPHHLVPVETEVVDGVTMLKLPRRASARARGFRADRSRHRSRPARSIRPITASGATTRARTAARRASRRRPATFKKSVFGVTLAGCPLDEKISEMNLVKARGNTIGALGHRRDRQSDVRRHRPPHLQRLHEGLHLPEAGAGRHSADRDPHAEGRAGAALGLRDLQPADALESAQPAPAAAEAGDRPQGAGGRAGPGGLHARASPDERRPHRGRRSTGSRSSRCRRRSPASTPTATRVPFRPIRDVAELRESLDEPRHGRASAASPNTASPCAGTRIS